MPENPRISWYRCKVDRSVMSELVRRNDARAFLQVGAQLGLFALTAMIAYAIFRALDVSNWPWMLPLLLLAVFLHGTNGSFFGGVACHELCHKTPFSSPFWNACFLRIYAFLSWFDPVGYRASHIRHHQTTTHADYDGEVVLPLRFDYRSLPFFFHAFVFDPAHIWRQLRFTLAAAQGDFTRDGFFKSAWLRQVVPETDEAGRREIVAWARVVLLGHLALAASFVLTGHWPLIVLINFGCLHSPWLSILVGLPQHYGLVPNTPDFRLCCRTYTCSWLPAFFYWNMQYHVEHHMFPAVPFYNLPRLRAAISHDLPRASHGLWAVWRDEILPIVRRQREDPDFMQVPVLPSQQGERVPDGQLLAEASQTQP